jgi:hypothetical protein
MLCCSKAGEKLPPLLIGKSRNPRAFKKINAIYKTHYRSNSKGWMNRELFEEWGKEINEKFKKEKRKVVLLLDNCSAHKILELSNISFEFLPANTTSIIQPLDLGIIKNFKDNYR